jgi:hypothetical protein
MPKGTANQMARTDVRGYKISQSAQPPPLGSKFATPAFGRKPIPPLFRRFFH